MNNNAALTPGVGTDVPGTALACARQTLPKERRGNRKTRGQERRITEHRRRATPQRASRLPWPLSLRLVPGMTVPASGAQAALRPLLRWQSSCTKLSDSLIPFSSSHQIQTKRCKISTAPSGIPRRSTVNRIAFRDHPRPSILHPEGPLLLSVTPAAPAIAKLVQAPEVQQPHMRPPRRSSSQTLTTEPRGHKGR